MPTAHSTNRRRCAFLSLLVLLACFAFIALPTAAQRQVGKPREVKHLNLGKDGLALAGYDPVSYFAEGGGKPRKGLATITVLHDGVLYRFATEDHKKLFLASPAKFEPQYGGWCAYAMADKDKVEIEPESFVVTDGKLYLFFKAWYADTRAKWLKDEKALMGKADKAWKELVEPKPKEGK